MTLPQLVTDEDIRRTEGEISSRIAAENGCASQESDAIPMDFRLALEDRIAPVSGERPDERGPISTTLMIGPIVLLMALAIELISGTFIQALWTASPAIVWLVLAVIGAFGTRPDLARVLVLMQFALCLHPVLGDSPGLVPATVALITVGIGAMLIKGAGILRSLLASDSCDGTGVA